MEKNHSNQTNHNSAEEIEEVDGHASEAAEHAHEILPSHLSHKTVDRHNKDALVKRMNRILGQVNGVNRMIQEDRYCVDVLMQINAVKAALDGVAMQLLEDHTKHCVTNAIQNGGGEEEISELIDIIRKYTK